MASDMWRRILRISSVVIFMQFYCVLGKDNVIKLNEDNWEEMLTKEWMVEFYAPWCPACKALQPMWEEFSTWSEDLDIHVGQVDVTTSPGLSGRFMVTALPTIFHVLDGEFRQYRGARDKEAFISFVEEKKWKSIDAIPSWKSPGSIQMSIVSYFFKLSQILRSVHNKLMEEYGLPTWGSYLIFAVATIFIGALLGLVLVCVIDLIYPPKPLLMKSPATTPSEKDGAFVDNTKDKMDENELEEEEDDYAKDDLVDEEGSAEVSMEEEEEDEEDEEEVEELEGGEGSPNVRKRKPRKAD